MGKKSKRRQKRMNQLNVQFTTGEAPESTFSYGFPTASSSAPKIKGLSNLGNTCYFNSTMQSLCSLSSLRNVDKAPLEDEQGDVLRFGNFTSNLLSFFDLLSGDSSRAQASSQQHEPEEHPTGGHGGGKSKKKKKGRGGGGGGGGLSPEHILGMIRKQFPQFRGHDQQDAHEVMLAIISIMEEEEARRVKLAREQRKRGLVADFSEMSLEDEKEEKDEKENDEEDEDEELYRERDAFERNRIRELFEIPMCSVIRCLVCGHCAYKAETAFDLSLPLPNAPSMSELLELHSSRRRKKKHGKQHRPKNRTKTYSGGKGGEEEGGHAYSLELRKLREMKEGGKKMSAKQTRRLKKLEKQEQREDAIQALFDDEDDGEDEEEALVQQAIELSKKEEEQRQEEKEEKEEEDNEEEEEEEEEEEDNEEEEEEELFDPEEPDVEGFHEAFLDFLSVPPKQAGSAPSTSENDPERTQYTLRDCIAHFCQEDAIHPHAMTEEQADEFEAIEGFEGPFVRGGGYVCPHCNVEERREALFRSGSGYKPVEEGKEGKEREVLFGFNPHDASVRTTATKRLLLFPPFSPSTPVNPLAEDSPSLAPKFPPIVTIHLKRLLAITKLDTDIVFPLRLDLGQLLADQQSMFEVKGEQTGTPSAMYRLSSMVVHQGGAYGGHYVAYVRRQYTKPKQAEEGEEQGEQERKEQWYYASDAATSCSSENGVLGAEGYILFYERVDQEQEVQEQEMKDQE